jgi:acetoin utilization protein AcuB
MFVSDWMTRKVFTVSPDDDGAKARAAFRERAVKHLPVLEGGKLVGILSDRDLKDFAASRSAEGGPEELDRALSKTRVKSLMRKHVVTVGADQPIEEAAMLMLDEAVGCLPVKDQGALVGIISDRDIFEALVDITGVRHRGHRFVVPVEDRPGAIKEVIDIVKKYGFMLLSVVTSYEGAKKGMRNVVIRTHGKGEFDALWHELQATYLGVKIKKG